MTIHNGDSTSDISTQFQTKSDCPLCIFSQYQEIAVNNEVNMESWEGVTRVAVVPHENLDLRCQRNVFA